MRLPFLVLPPACVALGAATAVFSGHDLNPYYLLIVFVGAMAAHICVNALNEYDDFKSGLDFKTERTPFSGGSGSIPQNPDKAHYALITGIVTLVVTLLVGLFFLYVRGLWIVPLGILGLVIVVTYTKWLTKNPLLCLIAPGLGFGPLMVMGTDFALTGTYSWLSFTASLVPFFLVSNLLLLNQFPDVKADVEVGRRHLPVAIGIRKSVWVYGFFLVLNYATICLGFLVGIFPLEGLISLATITIAIPTMRGVVKFADSIPKLIPYMAKNVMLIILTPVLLAIGLFIA
ncbi:MAG: prenyltransferase [Proteobacteria bacterium]|nr:prenyltransferase [Pseudomonadota bacterium]